MPDILTFVLVGLSNLLHLSGTFCRSKFLDVQFTLRFLHHLTDGDATIAWSGCIQDGFHVTNGTLENTDTGKETIIDVLLNRTGHHH